MGTAERAGGARSSPSGRERSLRARVLQSLPQPALRPKKKNRLGCRPATSVCPKVTSHHLQSRGLPKHTRIKGFSVVTHLNLQVWCSLSCRIHIYPVSCTCRQTEKITRKKNISCEKPLFYLIFFNQLTAYLNELVTGGGASI